MVRMEARFEGVFMKQRQTYENESADALAAGLVEVHDLLARLSNGDTTMRAEVIPEEDVFNGIKILINQLAEHIQQTNDYSHEIAMGLCEHYETLNRIANGDFSGRAAVNSGNEVVAKLGELINLEADTLTTAISRAQEAEEAMKSSNQQLLDIVDFLPDATFVVDKEKRVIAWNRAIERMTGVVKQDIIGKGNYAYALPFYNDNRPLLIDLLGQEHEQERILRNYTQIKQEGNALFTEVFVPSFRNGESRYLFATATPLFDKEGNQAGGIESIRDITEYKQSEEEKLRLQSQLNQAYIMETLMGRLGHDLKTPLTPMFVLLSLLKKRLTEPDLLKMVDMCLKNATSINNLADKTRILATLSSSVKPFELENVSLAAIVYQVIAECSEMISHKQVECRNNVDPEVVVRVVPAQLHVLFVNLISNAVHYSAAQGVITVSAEQQPEGMLISVRDEGAGLPATHLEHIFDEFFKADESRHDIDAPGLGLSICKRVVQNHHGRIWAESPGVGQGTTIRFTVNEVADVNPFYEKKIE
jgi:PAS domain S-box-containing protein